MLSASSTVLGSPQLDVVIGNEPVKEPCITTTFLPVFKNHSRKPHELALNYLISRKLLLWFGHAFSMSMTTVGKLVADSGIVVALGWSSSRLEHSFKTDTAWRPFFDTIIFHSYSELVCAIYGARYFSAMSLAILTMSSRSAVGLITSTLSPNAISHHSS